MPDIEPADDSNSLTDWMSTQEEVWTFELEKMTDTVSVEMSKKDALLWYLDYIIHYAYWLHKELCSFSSCRTAEDIIPKLEKLEQSLHDTQEFIHAVLKKVNGEECEA